MDVKRMHDMIEKISECAKWRISKWPPQRFIKHYKG